jgi:hypothetical protein
MTENIRSKLGATRIVIIFGIIYFISQTIIGLILHDLNPWLFVKAQTTFSKDVYLALLNQWEQTGLMSNYWHHFYLDFFHPIWYAVFLSALMAKAMTLNELSGRHNWLLLLPFVAGLMDLVENCFHVIFISDVHAITLQKIFISALAANIKWGLAGISIVTVIILFGRYLAKKT